MDRIFSVDDSVLSKMIVRESERLFNNIYLYIKQYYPRMMVRHNNSVSEPNLNGGCLLIKSHKIVWGNVRKSYVTVATDV